jgi:hypothetical protein
MIEKTKIDHPVTLKHQCGYLVPTDEGMMT